MKQDSTSGWEKLNCPFFAAACRRVFNDYLHGEGFIEEKITRTGGIIYRHNEVFLEISYVPETYPNYSPSIILGIGEDKFDKEGQPLGVPFWYLTKKDAEQNYTFWTFNSEKDLLSSLTKIKDSCLEAYGKRLWNDPDHLKDYIANFRNRGIKPSI
jgi:hypothetical protein